ncbi:MAG: LysR family transcriptional regulator [Polyangiaceae bacterium]|nr:LysR family transcriptional regulator [Polyangiaceae bacterium]
MNRLERIHLSLLREVARCGSLTAAAKSLGLTQSALSHTVRRIEQQFGTEVWQREGRGVRLTPAGSYLLALAQRVLPQLEHAELIVDQFARGERGTLRIGMECHPCYRWLLQVVEPFLRTWPDVDLDVRQKFQFGGVGALFGHEIDILVTPDPLRRKGLHFEPVFDYEQVLVVSAQHPFAGRAYVVPAELEAETLITYPVEVERLDVYSQFLLPAGAVPKRHKVIETTDIMLQMVACGRGVAALPAWLVEEYREKVSVVPVRLGRHGISKQIFLGLRAGEAKVDYVEGFVQLAKAKEVAKVPARKRAKKRARDVTRQD